MTEKQIWDFLADATGSDNMAAAIMGNLYAESALRSDNLQGAFEKKFGLTDKEYTDLVDRGGISREQFYNDHAGYGLAQWTYWSRKQGLYDYIKKHSGTPSIADTKLQLEYVIKELSTNYKSIWNVRITQSLEYLCDQILRYYEAPASKDEEKTILLRRGYAQSFYDKYAKTDIIKEIDSCIDKLKAIQSDVFDIMDTLSKLTN